MAVAAGTIVQPPAHSIAVSLADMSVWCYDCEAYLDVFRVKALHAPFAAIYRRKFGCEPSLPGWVGMSESGAGSSSTGPSSATRGSGGGHYSSGDDR